LKKVLIQLSMTENDESEHVAGVLESLKRFSVFDEIDVKIYVVYQAKSRNLRGLDVLALDNLSVYYTDVMSVSHARNAGLQYAVDEGFDYIYFHDSSIVVSDQFCWLVNASVKQSLDVSVGALKWERSSKLMCSSLRLSNKCIRPILDHCVSRYIFKVDFVKGVRFRENMGPGEFTCIKAGEDVVFLTQLFRGKNKKIPYSDRAIVFHPPRPTDNSKQLAYAEAQGGVARWLLSSKNVSFFHCFFVVAFFFNAFLKCLRMEPFSMRIFFLRVKGFLYGRKTFDGIE
jgi:hypothetical protein